jgi:DeoR/GlpR family transcriptional regulator of sugar metabolism
LTPFERRARLLAFLNDRPGIRVPDLARLLNVSEGTVRNDLRALAASGKLTRVWGGGVPLEERGVSLTFATRARMHQPAKLAIARVAAGLVQDGDAILLDASTTVFQMAACLRERHNLTVVTNGIEVAREMARDVSNTVILLGGVLRQDGSAISRPVHEDLLKGLNIQLAIISSSGFSLDAGLTEVDFYEALFKRAMIASARQVVALIDASKFGKVDLTSCAWLDQVSHIYTDERLPAEWREKLERAGVAFTICQTQAEPEKI